MNLLDDFREIIKPAEPLARYTYFQLGGPAEYMARPRQLDELLALVERCRQEELSLRVLGSGCNTLIRDAGVKGVVVKLDAPAFTSVRVEGNRLTAGAGALLTSLISHSTRRHLAGLEVLVGIPGTVGGAVKINAGGRSGDIGQVVRQVTVMDRQGEIYTRGADDLVFGYRESNIDEWLILDAQIDLEEDDQQEILKRMRRLWITKKATQPLSFQCAGCTFKNPRGLAAGALIDQAGLKGHRVGGAEVSQRHANFIIAHKGATARDVLRLIDVVRGKVAERFGVELES